MMRVCKECGREFELAPGEIKFYKSKNLALPKRCKDCRIRIKLPAIILAAQTKVTVTILVMQILQVLVLM